MGAKGGVERALKKLSTIKDQVIWWTKGAQTPQLLADGEVVMGSTYNGRLFSVIEEDKQPIGMLWDWQVFDLERGFQDFSFDYDVPLIEGDQGVDYFGIRPVVPEKSRALIVEEVKFERLRRWADD